MAVVLFITSQEGRYAPLSPSLSGAGLTPAFLTEPDRLSAITLEEAPDLVVVDWESLGAKEGQRATALAREARLPTLVLLTEEMLPYYEPHRGGDDFLVLPLRPAELASRLRALLWRTRGRDSHRTIRVGDLVIDPERYEVTVRGRRVLLTFKEYELLHLLASHPGRVFTREALLNRVWGYNYFGGTRTVDVHIRRLRSKLEEVSPHTYIETVRNVGYRFAEPSPGSGP